MNSNQIKYNETLLMKKKFRSTHVKGNDFKIKIKHAAVFHFRGY